MNMTDIPEVNTKNVFLILTVMNRKNQKKLLRRCYQVFRKEVFPNYSSEGVKSELKKYGGFSVCTIDRKIYGRKGKKK